MAGEGLTDLPVDDLVGFELDEHDAYYAHLLVTNRPNVIGAVPVDTPLPAWNIRQDNDDQYPYDVDDVVFGAVLYQLSVYGADAVVTSTGTSSAVETAEPSTATGTLDISGAANPTEVVDAQAASATLTSAGSAAPAETLDTQAAAASLASTGTATPAESYDPQVSAADLASTGTATPAETLDDQASAAQFIQSAAATGSMVELTDDGSASSAAILIPSVGTTAATEVGDYYQQLYGVASSSENNESLTAVFGLIFPLTASGDITEVVDRSAAPIIGGLQRPSTATAAITELADRTLPTLVATATLVESSDPVFLPLVGALTQNEKVDPAAITAGNLIAITASPDITERTDAVLFPLVASLTQDERSDTTPSAALVYDIRTGSLTQDERFDPVVFALSAYAQVSEQADPVLLELAGISSSVEVADGVLIPVAGSAFTAEIADLSKYVPSLSIDSTNVIFAPLTSTVLEAAPADSLNTVVKLPSSGGVYVLIASANFATSGNIWSFQHTLQVTLISTGSTYTSALQPDGTYTSVGVAVVSSTAGLLSGTVTATSSLSQVRNAGNNYPIVAVSGFSTTDLTGRANSVASAGLQFGFATGDLPSSNLINILSTTAGVGVVGIYQNTRVPGASIAPIGGNYVTIVSRPATAVSGAIYVGLYLSSGAATTRSFRVTDGASRCYPFYVESWNFTGGSLNGQAAYGTLLNYGNVDTTASAASSELFDTQAALAVASDPASGTATAIESSDTQVAPGDLQLSGTAAIYESSDIQVVAGTLATSGTAAATESAEPSTSSAAVGISLRVPITTGRVQQKQFATGTNSAFIPLTGVQPGDVCVITLTSNDNGNGILPFATFPTGWVSNAADIQASTIGSSAAAAVGYRKFSAGDPTTVQVDTLEVIAWALTIFSGADTPTGLAFSTDLTAKVGSSSPNPVAPTVTVPAGAWALNVFAAGDTFGGILGVTTPPARGTQTLFLKGSGGGYDDHAIYTVTGFVGVLSGQTITWNNLRDQGASFSLVIPTYVAVAPIGSGTPTELQEVSVSSSTAVASGTAAATEPVELSTGTVTQSSSGASAAVDSQDTSTGTITQSSLGSGSSVETLDTSLTVSLPGAAGAATGIEQGDPSAATATLASVGFAGVTEVKEAAKSAGFYGYLATLVITGNLSAAATLVYNVTAQLVVSSNLTASASLIAYISALLTGIWNLTANSSYRIPTVIDAKRRAVKLLARAFKVSGGYALPRRLIKGFARKFVATARPRNFSAKIAKRAFTVRHP